LLVNIEKINEYDKRRKTHFCRRYELKTQIHRLYGIYRRVEIFAFLVSE
jgi:uncharacterized protein YnzC (UPF0291/DUF896 family)